MKTAIPIAADLESSFIPVLLREIELSQPLPTFAAFDMHREHTYQRVRCLVRLHAQPLGQVDLIFERDELSPCDYASHIWQTLGDQINAHLREDGLPEVAGLDESGLSALQTPKCIVEREAFLKTAPFASVVISTRDRPTQLARCLQSLLALYYSCYEVIVVDNAPSNSATFEFIQKAYGDEPKIRYVREERPGSSMGRNRGVLEARGEIIAFTDDDVVVDPYWLVELVRGFHVAENVACVTGLILPLELETPAQFLLEARGGFIRGFEQRIFDLREHNWNKPAYPYTADICGSGANMAFTATFLRQEGGFDPALGPGRPTLAAEETALFFRVIIHGYRLVYESASLVYHQHYRDYPALQKQLYGYGVGFTAYLTKVIIDHPWLIFDCFDKFVHALFVFAYMRSAEPKGEADLILRKLKRLQRKGELRGPLAYVRSRWSCGWARTGLALVKGK